MKYSVKRKKRWLVNLKIYRKIFKVINLVIFSSWFLGKFYDDVFYFGILAMCPLVFYFFWELKIRGSMFFQAKGTGSMLPTITGSDLLVVKKIRRGKPIIKEGDIIIFNHINLYRFLSFKWNPLVKRISRVEEEGVFVLGDNRSNSWDSRYFGLVEFKDITHIVQEIIAVENLGGGKYEFRKKSLALK